MIAQPERHAECDDPERLLTPKELAGWAQVPLRTVRQWSTRGGGPPRIRIGRHVRYRWADCLAWRDSNRVD